MPLAFETYYESPVSEGPTLPAMKPGLPSTSAAACQELLLYVVVHGLLDGLLMQENSFVMGRQFEIYCLYIGLDPETTAKIQAMFYKRQIKPEPLEAILRGAYLRFGSSDDEGHPTAWDSWGGGLRLPSNPGY